ncbi:MAG: LamB/YcsF family protein, partial [Armatimonadetes bacterium]|nr:LamB/YcsF family protein [Armatimonadota bacterium]
RGAEGELLNEPAAVAARAAALALGEPIPTVDGTTLRIHADTLCLHGDKPGTSDRARAIRAALAAAHVDVRPMGEWIGGV